VTASRHLIVVVPGLCGPESDPPVSAYLHDCRPAALDRLLSRGRVFAGSGTGLDTTLGFLFGLAPGGEMPVAALTWLADTGQSPAGWIMRADPVHLRADQSCLRLFDSHCFDISRAEADALVAACNDFYREQGWSLSAPRPQRWYLSLPEPPVLQTQPPARIAGQDIDPCLPRGAEAGDWHALLNEVQMLLHGHPVNLERERRGEPVINSIWPWGGGALTERLESRVMRVLANEPLAMGLARHAALPLAGLPATAGELLDALTGGDTLLVDDRLEWPERYGEVESWLDALQALEAGWFAPLLQVLLTGTLASLEIHPCNGHSYHVTRASLRRFWKPLRPFESVCTAR